VDLKANEVDFGASILFRLSAMAEWKAVTETLV
jgi:hypothetical protein